MRIARLIGVILVVLIPGVGNAQRVAGNCSVNGSFYDMREKLGSGVSALGKFPTTPARDTFVKTFGAYNDLKVTVNIQYDMILTDLRPRWDGIRVAIAASNHELSEIFDSPESSVATIALRKRWNLAVSKTVLVDDKRYTFTVLCRDAVNPVRRSY